MTKKRRAIIGICSIVLMLAAIGLLCLLLRKKDIIDYIPAKSRAVAIISPSSEDAGKELKQLLNDILDLQIEGLDLSSPAYFFITPNEYYGFAIRVSAAEDIAKSFQNLKIEEADGAQWLWYGDAWQLCWTDDVLLALGPTSIDDQAHIKRTLSIMLDASADDGFGHSERYEQLAATEGDIRLFSRLDVLPMPYGLPFKMCVPDTCDADRVLIFAHAKHTDGKWQAECEITSEDSQVLKEMEAAQKRSTTIAKIEPEGVGTNNLLFIAGTAEQGRLSKMISKDNTLQMLFASFNDSTNVKQRIKTMTGGYSFCLENLDENLHAACVLSGQGADGAPIVLTSQQKLSAAAYEGEKVAERAEGLQYYFHLNFEPLRGNKTLQEKHPTIWNILSHIKNITYTSATNRKATIIIE